MAVNITSSAKTALILISLLLLAPLFSAVPGDCQAALMVSDTPDDWGTSLTLLWDEPAFSVRGYEVWRLNVRDGPSPRFTPTDSIDASAALAAAGWERVGDADPEDSMLIDSGLNPDSSYSYILLAGTQTTKEVWGPTEPQAPVRQWLRYARTNILVVVLMFMGTVVLLVEWARRGAKLFIRRIAGLEAVEEAVGRATEMGRPILYVPGLDPMDEVATVAAVNILGQVAKTAGKYETKLVVPNRDPIVMAVAQQVVRESYSTVGKPHLYQEENVFYVTFSQFGFAAAVAGLMIREKPATNFFIGRFYAESLVLAETGNATGAIQIAGTDSDAQLPFFISACDYTLIGEELYAGSVYLSREPLLLGALKAQDYAKAIIIAAIGAGIVLYMLNPGIAERFAALFE